MRGVDYLSAEAQGQGAVARVAAVTTTLGQRLETFALRFFIVRSCDTHVTITLLAM